MRLVWDVLTVASAVVILWTLFVWHTLFNCDRSRLSEKDFGRIVDLALFSTIFAVAAAAFLLRRWGM